MNHIITLTVCCLFLSNTTIQTEKSDSFTENEEANSIGQAFLGMVSGLFSIFSLKKVAKTQDTMIENGEPMTRNKYLTKNLDEDLAHLKKGESKIKERESGKLLAILEILEAIELNLKMAQQYENRVNRLCSVYFPEIDEILKDQSNNDLDPFTFISKYIPNFTHPDFVKSETEGIFITKYLSRFNQIEDDDRIINFVVENLETVTQTSPDDYLLHTGNESNVYLLPEDEADEEAPNKVIKKMNFKDMYYEEMKSSFLNNEPILDLILLMIETKRAYFQEVFKEIEINAQLNRFMKIDSVFIEQTKAVDNNQVVNFYGCLNIRTQKNYKSAANLKVIETIRTAYMALVETPDNIRDLDFEDLEDIVDGRPLDMSKAGKSSSVDELSVQYKIEVLYKFFVNTNLYEDYEYLFVLERMEVDLFDDMFQKIYFLLASSLGERLRLYTTLVDLIEKLHHLGYTHCDVKVANFLYKIQATNNHYNINYQNFRIIDFDNAQSLREFCKGGARGYLAPEVENKLELPFSSSEFMAYLRSLDDVSEPENDNIIFSKYSDFVNSLKVNHSILIPEDYIDFRLTISNGSFNNPSHFRNWMDLMTHMTPMFQWMNVIPKIDYKPQLQDVTRASEKLMILTRDKQKGKKSTQSQEGEFNINRTKYALRNLQRKALEEGAFYYDPGVIYGLNKADTFSLGILFTEIETSLNSESIFETFKAKLEEHSTQEFYEENLYSPISLTFRMKKNEGALSNSLKEQVLPFFKSEVDMNLSANNYSNELKQLKNNLEKKNLYVEIVRELESLILEMISYYSYDRPDIKKVKEQLKNLNEKYAALRTDRRYSRLMNAIESNIRLTSAKLFKAKFKQIYGTAKRLLVI